MHACMHITCMTVSRKPNHHDISWLLPRGCLAGALARSTNLICGFAVALHASRILRSVILLSSHAADTVVDATLSHCNPSRCCLQWCASHVICSCVAVLLCVFVTVPWKYFPVAILGMDSCTRTKSVPSFGV